MSLETLQPDAIGPIDQWTLGAGSKKQVAVQLPDDDDTTYISEMVAGQIQEFEVDNPSDILFADTISSVTLHYRARFVAGTAERVIPGLRVGGGTLDEGASQILTGSYVNYSDTFALNPDSANWSLADLNSLRIRVRYVSGTAQIRVTTLRAEVQYTRASKKSQHTMMLGVG
jgi:hypothetical protein